MKAALKCCLGYTARRLVNTSSYRLLFPISLSRCSLVAARLKAEEQGGGEGVGWGWGAVCVSSALRRNKRTHGGSSQAGFSVSLTVDVREFLLSPVWTVSQTCNSCSVMWGGTGALALMCFVSRVLLQTCTLQEVKVKYPLRSLFL